MRVRIVGDLHRNERIAQRGDGRPHVVTHGAGIERQVRRENEILLPEGVVKGAGWSAHRDAAVAGVAPGAAAASAPLPPLAGGIAESAVGALPHAACGAAEKRRLRIALDGSRLIHGIMPLA
jgi:hypothetical protein